MTTVIKKLDFKPLESPKDKVTIPEFLINGKLEKFDWQKNHNHFFQFLEIISKLLRNNIPEKVFSDSVLHFQNIYTLLLESHQNDTSFQNDDVLAYFLAVLEYNLVMNGKDIQEKNISRILRFWGMDKDHESFLKKISLAKQNLENAELFKISSDFCIKELQTKVFQWLKYLEELLQIRHEKLEMLKEKVLDLSERKIIPYANLRESALTMIVAFFPTYINLPAARLVILLNLRRDFQVNLTALRKRVKRYQERLQKYKII